VFTALQLDGLEVNVDARPALNFLPPQRPSPGAHRAEGPSAFAVTPMVRVSVCETAGRRGLQFPL
jgi:hypothetical protein